MNINEWTDEQKEYIESVADDYGVDYITAYNLADMLGESELYDGFIASMQDAECYV